MLVCINVYSFDDIRVARVVCSNEKLEEFIERNMCVCQECGTVNVFDKKNVYDIKGWQCKKCVSELVSNQGDFTSVSIAKKMYKKSAQIDGQLTLWDI